MASASETFYCPHCSVSLTKSAAASILGGAGAAYVSNLPSAVTCPKCGGDIDTQKMISGEYDHGSGSALGCTIMAVAMVGGTYWISTTLGYNVFGSAAMAYGAILVAGLAILGGARILQKLRG